MVEEGNRRVGQGKMSPNLLKTFMGSKEMFLLACVFLRWWYYSFMLFCVYNKLVCVLVYISWLLGVVWGRTGFFQNSQSQTRWQCLASYSPISVLNDILSLEKPCLGPQELHTVPWRLRHPPVGHCDTPTRTIRHCNDSPHKHFHIETIRPHRGRTVRPHPNRSVQPLRSGSKC